MFFTCDCHIIYMIDAVQNSYTTHSYNNLVTDPWTCVVNMGFHTTCVSTTGGGSQMLTVFPPIFEVAKCPSFPTNVTRCFVSDVLCNKENRSSLNQSVLNGAY